MVYVSEIIRADETNSWYFVRDYAEKFNLEETCKNCYSLPEYEDLENFKSKLIKDKWSDNGEYESLGGSWLKSWSTAPIGMTIGNFPFLQYTFSYIFDIILHPLTW
jgi:hypothetical protein